MRSELRRLLKQSQGFLSQNLFRVNFGLPPGLGFDAERLSLSAVAASLPGVAFTHSEIEYGDQARFHVAAAGYNAATFTFLISNTLYEHQVFTAWRDLVVDSSGKLGWYNDYVTDITISPIRRNAAQSAIASFVLHEAVPETVGDVDMSYDSENSLARLTVSFRYRHWEMSNAA